jgi:hypothetical protein
MDYKGQTTVLAAIFVLVGMVFLVPTITEKALAVVTGAVYGTCGAPDSQPQIDNPCVFTISGVELKGADAPNVKWTSYPACINPQTGDRNPDCTSLSWATKGDCLTFAMTDFLSAKAGCDEQGTVQVKVGGGGEASLYFNSPGRLGIPSQCEVRILDAGPGKLSGSCKVTDIPPNIKTSIDYHLHSDTK